MVFSKSFPKNVPSSNYPIWEEVVLEGEEENKVEEECRRENNRIMGECLMDAKSLAIKNGVNDERNVAILAVGLFEKRSSHVVFWKEEKAKEIFDNKKSF